MSDQHDPGQPETVSGTAGDAKRELLIRLLEQAAARDPGGEPEPETAPEIAIVGVSGRYPEAETLARFWENLKSGRNCTGEIPEDRWDWRAFHDPAAANGAKSYSKWGGFLKDVDKFDPLFFNIAPAEAEAMDPQERLFLETVWALFEDAGTTRRDLARWGRGVGVFVGVSNSHYDFLSGAALAKGQLSAARSAFWSVANRISSFFDLQGPSMAVDTACSSSLTAIHLACESIRRGECRAAVAGGVNLILHPQHLIQLAGAGMLAKSEKCQSFGAGADGFVDGEGVGAVLLRPLDQALADGDPIYAVIKGTAVNHGGKTSGYTVPNPTAQGDVIETALRQAGIDPRTLSYLEAHGTGTPLGDPIEIAGLTRAFGSDTPEKQYCAIGSVKSNIGHLESAAGVAGLTKVLLQIKHGQLTPSIHSETLNPEIDFAASPFRVQHELTPWERPVIDGTRFPRRAGISSFGAGGANVHLILEELPNHAHRPEIQPPGPWIFVLSAPNQESLRAYTAVMVDFLQTQEQPAPHLADIAYTLQLGREAMAERLAVVSASRQELAGKLARFAQGETETADLYLGTAQPVPATSEQPMDGGLENRRLDEVARFWVTGGEIDWRRLYQEPRPKRVSLPTYPFARERYWAPDIDLSQLGAAMSGGPRAATPTDHRLHPLLQRNTSDLSGLKFSTTFTGREFFLADHMVNGQRILPGAAYLEMARAAIDRAAPAPGARILRIENVVWAQPVVVENDPAEVHIGLQPEGDGKIAYQVYSEPAGADAPVVHSRGRLILDSVPVGGKGQPPALDIPALQAQCRRGLLSSQKFYETFRAFGIDYGPGHRGVESLALGVDQVLARLSVPDSLADDRDNYVLHPSLMDSAVQASIGLKLEADQPISSARAGKPSLAFALQEIQIFRPCDTSMWALIRDRGQKLDIDLCDPRGTVCVRMKGLLSRPVEAEPGNAATAEPMAPPAPTAQPLVGKLLLTPVWQVTPVAAGESFPCREDDTLIVGGTEGEISDIQRYLPNARPLDMDAGNGLAEISARLKTCGTLTHLLWIAPQEGPSTPTDEALISGQSRGVLQLFRIVKALLGLGYGSRELGLTLITTQTLPVHELDRINPVHASVHGLAGSLAKEQPGWKIRCLDLDAGNPWPLPSLFALPSDPMGNAWVYRAHQWHRQQLIPWRHPPVELSSYRQGGVYVVLGGAGGLGTAWSEHLIRGYGARIIWIGRRPRDAAIEARLDALGAHGPTPEYVAADATDRQALEAAYREIRSRHPQIHGIVLSAVTPSEGSLADLDEERFKAGLAVKVDASVNMAHVFGAEPLDFVLFFSSINAFMKAKRSASYAAGCNFTDLFARHLAQQWPCAVKVMDWGYWGSIGQIADSKMFQSWMAHEGLGSIEPPEAMETLETLLTGPAGRLALVKTTKPLALEGLCTGVEESLSVYARTLPSCIHAIQQRAPEHDTPFDAATVEHGQEMEQHLSRLLLAQLHRMGIFREGRLEIAALENRLQDLYTRWLDESIAMLARNGLLASDGESHTLVDAQPPDLEALWESWDARKETWLGDPGLRAQVRLVDETLRVLPDILTGQRLATDILFPDSSMVRVEGIYKDNPAADYLNDVLAETVAAYIRERLAQDAAAEIRILEIGAGTGGTTARVLAGLEPFRNHLRDYRYTDLSRSFLLHAEEAYGKRFPYLSYGVFDVEAPIDQQDLPADGFDLIIAANVLHATRDIRRTLRHAKAALHNRGLLVLNEVSSNSLATHLTFGLLEGWWLHEDTELRIPGCPGLYPETWQWVLESEGFRSVFFPTRGAPVGSQIIVAESDGVVRRANPPGPEAAVAPVAQRVRPVTPTIGADGVTDADVAQRVTEVVMEKLSETLKIDPARISADAPFSASGLDSIFGVRFVEVVNRALGIDLETTCIFDYSSVRQLSAHIVAGYGDEISAGLRQDRTAATEPRPADTSRAWEREPQTVAEPKSPPMTAEPTAKPMTCDQIAVIGMAGQFPDANTPDAFWQNMVEGRDPVRELPAQSSGSEARGENPIRGGFLEERDCFDPLFFGISPREAKAMDPHQRLILQESWKALEDAGYNPRSLANAQVGTFIGAEPSGYESDSFTGSSHAIIASRLAYTLNLNGPAMVVNTGCSSSGVAIHLACESLRNGESAMALAGGVFAELNAAALSKLTAIGMVSPTGTCRTFDALGDGTVISEGVGVVVLKRLRDALADGDPIHGVIQGSGINQDGASNGITAPNGAAQERLISEVYQRFGIDPEQISHVEAHGTGTRLGDPIEANALIRAYRRFTDRQGYCALGSAKSHIGHTAAAAGVIGLIKILLSLRHGQIPGLLHLETPNPHIAWEGSAFELSPEVREWRAGNGKPLTAALNSFGHSGTNVHLVVRETSGEERPAQAARPPVAGPSRLIPLSAKDPDRLREYAGKLLDDLKAKDPEIDLASLAYTLQTGREAMAERIIFQVTDPADLAKKLEQYRDGREEISGCRRGRVKQVSEKTALCDADATMNEAIRQWAAKGKLGKIAELWILGIAVNWASLYEVPPRRISLPTYPFAKERFGKPEQGERYERAEPPAPAGSPEPGSSMLVPVWETLAVPERANFPNPGERVIIVGGSEDRRRDLGIRHPGAGILDPGPRDDIDAIVHDLESLGHIDHILWLAPENKPVSVADEALIEAQEQGALAVFRVIKALLRLGYAARELGWTLITLNAQSVQRGDPVNPSHASLHGLVGSMAKEYPNWKIRLLDLEADRDWPLDEMFRLPADPKGNALAYRNGQWHSQRLIPFSNPRPVAKNIRPEGVFVVIGGAGGIGAAWSEHMIRDHQARIIWIGRRHKDASIQAEIDRLASFGSAPHYIAADATDREAMQRAYAEIKQRHGRINGLVHSAIVLQDRSLAQMEEASFRSVLSAKVDVCVRLAQVFGQEPLDFVLFFSAAMSFLKAPGQSNYAAGCTFKDAFAQQLSREWPCAVKVMNWGYWGSVGRVASKAVRERMAQSGIASIEPPEAMAALEILLGGPVDQIAMLKTSTPAALDALNPSKEESIAVYPRDLPSLIERLRGHMEQSAEPMEA